MNAVINDPEKYRYSALQVAVSKFGQSLHRLSPEQRRDAESIACRQYEIQSRLLAAPEASHVTVPEEQLDQQVQRIILRYANEDEFFRELQENQLSLTAFRHSVDRELRVQAVMDLVSAAVAPCSETDARIYYYLHPEKFLQPELREAWHILITVNPDYPENQQANAWERAAAIARRLQKKPERFAEQALKYSECPTAMNNGYLGQIKSGTLFPSLDKTLFSMTVGEVSDVIESPLGYHVLHCAGIHRAGQVPIGKALPVIREKLTERSREQHLKSWIKQVLNQDSEAT
ncbi:MAG: nitrogen fixation protein NifM [Ketobacteraceae bacterium]|nr:nitrogen fixation protein NifM [Ketobacteraceae bacterium]